MRYFSSIVFFILLACAQAAAQSFTTHNYSVAEGMPSPEVYDIFQDRKGFMWFATDNGVVKFDGKEMKIFHLKEGLTDPVVFGLQEDAKGRLWFRTFSGKLSYYENDTIKPYAYNETLKKFGYNGLVNVSYQSDSEALWFAVRKVFGKIDAAGQVTIDTLDEPAYQRSLICKNIGSRDLLLTSKVTGGINGIYIDDHLYPVQVGRGTYPNRVFCKLYWRDKLYLSIYNDVFEYDGKTVKTVLRNDQPVISLSKDAVGSLWVGLLNGGVKRIDDPDFKKAWEPDFLKQKSVTKVHQSTDGSLWFSTLESGIYYLPDLSIMNYKMPEDSKIRSVAATKKFVAVGDKAGTLRFYDPGNKKFFHTKKFHQNISSLFCDSKDNLWVSDYNAITLYNSDLSLKKSFTGRIANDYHEDSDSMVWTLGSMRIHQFDQQQNLIEEHRADNIYRSIMVLDTSIFLAGRIGLNIRNKNFAFVNTPKEFANFKIANIVDLNDSTLLIATMGNGFTILNKSSGSIMSYSKENRFIANNIYAVLKKDSMLWIGTENGLAVTPVRSLLDGNPNFNYLTTKSGLLSNKISFMTEGYNAVWAFSDDGFSVIPDTFDRFANKKPPFFIKTISVNGSAIPSLDAIELRSDQNNIRVEFGFISFNNQNIFLRYRINPGNPWIHTQDRSLQFSSLAPGEYTFDIEYSADNINWQIALPATAFVITPPWWRRWYVYPAILIVIASLSYFYFRYQQSIYRQKHRYLRIINDHQQKLIQSEIVTLERERNRIARELHDRVGTNLTAIKLMVSQLLQNYKEPLAHDIEEQFQIAIKEIKDIIYGLTPPSLERYGLFTGLRNYIGKLNKTIPLNISLKTFGKEVHNYELNIMVFRVLQELLTNSIKHSFAKNITIHLSAFENVLNVVYEDDGVGFSYDPVQSGMGLNNIESRINSVKGTLKFESGKFGVSYTIDIPIHLNKEVV